MSAMKLEEERIRPQALLRALGVGFEIAVLIGNTIGSEILRNPGIVFFVTFRKLDS